MKKDIVEIITNQIFKGISPIIEKPDYSFISVTVQELKQEIVDEEQEIGIPAHECVGCGLH